MPDTRQTAEERLEQESRSEQSPPAQSPRPADAPAPADGKAAQTQPRSNAEQPGEDGAAPVTNASEDSGSRSRDRGGDLPTQIEDSDENVLRGDVDELVAVGAQRDEYLALAQRTQADFENYRKRVARESALAHERGVAKLVKELLPALDNLDRALEAAQDDDPLLDGVRLVRSELSAALARVGVESFSPLGERFDPAVHEAMATTEQPANGAECGTIVEVYEPGYRLGENVIRPARVVVAA
jgi:molecular chaperone GrpE